MNQLPFVTSGERSYLQRQLQELTRLLALRENAEIAKRARILVEEALVRKGHVHPDNGVLDGYISELDRQIGHTVTRNNLRSAAEIAALPAAEEEEEE